MYPLSSLAAAGLESLSIERLYRLANTSVHLVWGLLVHYMDLPNSRILHPKLAACLRSNEYPWQFLGWRARAKSAEKHCDRDRTCRTVFVLSCTCGTIFGFSPSFSCVWELSVPSISALFFRKANIPYYFNPVISGLNLIHWHHWK